MESYTIGQVAERTGFPATALRYYEEIGLVPPAGRTVAGYRLYDDRTLTRLAFIARAKQLGCSLEEITDLVAIWDGEHCGPVQRRLHDLVTSKLGATDSQLTELSAFRAQLLRTAARLSSDPVDGPCGDDCACLHDERPERTESVEIPIACTLAADAVGERIADWDRVLAAARQRVALPSGGVRVELDGTVDIADLTRLVVAEQACCAFFRFAITVDERGLGLEVDASTDAHDLITAVFGPATR